MILWPMLVVVPVLFVWLAVKITPAMQIPVQLVDRGTTTISLLGMRDVHAVIMVPIAVAFLSAVAGIFVVDDARVADRRLVLSGLPAPSVAAARGVLVLILVGVICAASIAGMTFDFSPRQLSWFVAANLLTGVVYALLGALAAVLLGRLGAFFAMFVLPFLDIGLAQNVMFAPVAPSWGAWMPAHGTASIIIDASFTNTPDQTALLGLTAAWIAAASLCVLIAFRRKSSTL